MFPVASENKKAVRNRNFRLRTAQVSQVPVPGDDPIFEPAG